MSLAGILQEVLSVWFYSKLDLLLPSNMFVKVCKHLSELEIKVPCPLSLYIE